MSKVTFKEVFESDNWKITRIDQGYDGSVRIDAVTRHRIADGVNRFSKWGKESYLERLAREEYGKGLSEFNCYSY